MNSEKILELIQGSSFALSTPIIDAINNQTLLELKNQLHQEIQIQEEQLREQIISNKDDFIENFKQLYNQQQDIGKFKAQIDLLKKDLEDRQSLLEFDKTQLEIAKNNYLDYKNKFKLQQKQKKQQEMKKQIEIKLKEKSLHKAIYLYKKLEDKSQYTNKIRNALRELLIDKEQYDYIYELYEDLDFESDFKSVRISLFEKKLKEKNNLSEMLQFYIDFQKEQKILCSKYDMEYQLDDKIQSIFKKQLDSILNQLDNLRLFKEYLDQKQKDTGPLLQDLFIKYSLKKVDNLLEEQIQKFENLVNNENYLQISAEFDQFSDYSQLFGENDSDMIQLQETENKIQLPFTQTIDQTIKDIRSFIESLVFLLQYDKDQVHIKLDHIYNQYIQIYLKQLQDLDPVLVSLTYQNALFLSKTLDYYQNFIENKYKIINIKEYKSQTSFQQFFFIIQEHLVLLFQKKIDQNLNNYDNVTFCPKKQNPKAEQFIENVSLYINSNLSLIQKVNHEQPKKLLFKICQYINTKYHFQIRYFDFLKEKKYNIVGLANLAQDIAYIFSSCCSSIPNSFQYLEPLLRIRKFIHLFLDNTISQKKDQQQDSDLDLKWIQTDELKALLLNYEKIKHANLPVISKSVVKSFIDALD